MNEPNAGLAADPSVRERRLAGRLEGFGDIVFGFAISQCALLLTNASGRVDISRPISLAVYLGTFALIVSLWLIYHRMVSAGFRPAGLDLFLAFAFLALVSLMPYAMYAQIHATASLQAATAAVAEYSLLYSVLMAIGATVNVRNLRRAWYDMNEPDRNRTWLAVIRQCILAAVMAIGLVVDLTVGPTWSGYIYVTIVLFMRIARSRFGRAPSAAKLRIAIR
jgi:uncharacterized membrane protein